MTPSHFETTSVSILDLTDWLIWIASKPRHRPISAPALFLVPEVRDVHLCPVLDSVMGLQTKVLTPA